MNKFFYFLLFLFILLSVLFFNCQPTGNEENITRITIVQTGLIKMMTVPKITNFPMGYTGLAEPVHTVPLISSFKMGKYEVTYDEWFTVKIWADANGYNFANKGLEGHAGTPGKAPTTRKNQPVTSINWRDAIVWCNAASQYDGLTPCYKYNGNIIKDSRNSNASACDNAACSWSANGYRLPTEAEWEACARFNNGTTWTPGTYASGAGADYTNETVCGNVAWYSVNSGSSTHDIGTKDANNLAIFDMSGNVWEWCWDWYGDYSSGTPYTDNNPKGPSTGVNRVTRGGSYEIPAVQLQICYRGQYFNPVNMHYDRGLRVCRAD